MTEPRWNGGPSPGLIARAVRQAVLVEFRHDSCIASTRVTLEVCRYWGLAARPQAVKVQAFTPQAWQQRAALRNVPVDKWPKGAWSVGIAGSGKHGPGRWDGHLVALHGRWLIDPSLDQLARPQHGLLVLASAFRMPEQWGGALAEDEVGMVTMPDGTVIIYESLDDQEWRQSPNWSAKSPAIKRVTGAAIKWLTS